LLHTVIQNASTSAHACSPSFSLAAAASVAVPLIEKSPAS
jgi:hypothetical protein